MYDNDEQCYFRKTGFEQTKIYIEYFNWLI